MDWGEPWTWQRLKAIWAYITAKESENVQCPNCKAKAGFDWVSRQGEHNQVRCQGCKHEGDFIEFGGVTHCQSLDCQPSEEVLAKVEQGLGGVDEAASLRQSLAWEKECCQQAEEDMAEARYWARKLYQDNVDVFKTFNRSQGMPNWITWVEGSKVKAVTP